MPRRSWQPSDHFALLSLLVACAALAVSLYPPVREYVTSTRVTIEGPIPGARIDGPVVTVDGEVGHLRDSSHDLWLVVRPQTARRWYPTGTLTVQPDGRWTVRDVVLGERGHFRIFVVDADSAASDEFADWQQENESSADPPPMESLPPGATPVADVEIEQVS